VQTAAQYTGALVEYLDEGKLCAGFVLREQARNLAIIDGRGRERLVPRDLVMVRYGDHKTDRDGATEAIAALGQERAALAAELDLELLWQVVHEQGRNFTAPELAELFFGSRDSAQGSVMLEALLNDRIYFVRRHMEFLARTPEQVERLRVQQDRIRAKSTDYRKMLDTMRAVLDGAVAPSITEAAALIDSLTRYLMNQFTRSRELTQMLAEAAPDVDPAEAAFEIVERLGARPSVPRFAFIAGLKPEFSEAAMREAENVAPPARPVSDGGFSVTIDDEDTVEVDDALSCEPLKDGGLRVRVHIALVADFVAKGGAMDQEAAARATTVYLPEATIRMLPDAISCAAASLSAGEERPVLTTDITLSEQGEVRDARIYPARIAIHQRLDYDLADRILAAPAPSGEAADTLRRLFDAASKLRERRRTAGAMLIQRREPKVRVHGDDIEIVAIDSASPARTLVAEFMVLSNFVAARYAAENRIPIIYRVQPVSGGDLGQRPRLSLYPEYHAGIGLDYYAQLSSPIRRYADLVMQRQLIAALANQTGAYVIDELLQVLAGAENAEASGRELERRAKRYWILRYLERHASDTPMRAFATRDGASAELVDYAVRGSLHGSPMLANQAPIMVQLARVDALRGWLAFDYVGSAETATEGAR
jgi:exoribonuclease II